MIHPSLVTMFQQTGTGNMGDVTDESSVARFSMPGADRYVLAVVNGLFTGGSGTGADLVVRVDHRRGPSFDFHHVKFEKMGTDNNERLAYRVPEDDLFHHVYLRDAPTNKQDVIVLTWTNPDSGNMRWAIEVGLIDVALLEAAVINATISQ